MGRFLKWSIIVLAGLVVVAVVGFRVMKDRTKQASPEETVTFTVGDLNATVNYSRPSVKGRPIFGHLVPYGKVWRTGANEPTTITFDRPVRFGGTTVEPGKYTLWTIPGPTEWSVILNRKMYGWGIDFDGNATREPIADVARAKVAPNMLDRSVEQFTITVEPAPTRLVLSWEHTQVEVVLEP
ncbi:MAG: DUF2911 domain-containing protein [Flavobacteriales bacterium]|nr:DUF2911 domain-containing protein [Flavobacteriales bacterium]